MGQSHANSTETSPTGPRVQWVAGKQGENSVYDFTGLE